MCCNIWEKELNRGWNMLESSHNCHNHSCKPVISQSHVTGSGILTADVLAEAAKRQGRDLAKHRSSIAAAFHSRPGLLWRVPMPSKHSMPREIELALAGMGSWWKLGSVWKSQRPPSISIQMALIWFDALCLCSRCAWDCGCGCCSSFFGSGVGRSCCCWPTGTFCYNFVPLKRVRSSRYNNHPNPSFARMCTRSIKME